MAQLRAKGIQSYGVGPASTEADALNYPAHGDVEALAESSLYPSCSSCGRRSSKSPQHGRQPGPVLSA